MRNSCGQFAVEQSQADTVGSTADILGILKPRMTRRSAIGALAASAVMRGAAEKAYFPPPDSQGGWRTLKEPDKIRKTGGMDPDKLDAVFEYISKAAVSMED